MKAWFAKFNGDRRIRFQSILLGCTMIMMLDTLIVYLLNESGLVPALASKDLTNCYAVVFTVSWKFRVGMG